MARPQKKGADYFPFDVGFFNDRKIKELRGKFGAGGTELYIYLLCLIYEENGYFFKLDDGFFYVAAADLSMNSEKIGQIINFLCKRSLFDNKLFTSDKVLTSHGIQMRFQEIVKSRGQKNEIAVNSKFWVLKKQETQSYIKVAHFEGYSENNSGYSENNSGYSVEKLPKVNKSKVKESVEDKPSAHSKKPALEEIKSYCKERNNYVDPERFFDYYEANGWKVGKNAMKDWKAAVRAWEKNEYSLASQKKNYDQREYGPEELEEIFRRKSKI